MTNSLDSVRDVLAAVTAHHDALDELYAAPEPSHPVDVKRRSKQIAGLHESIRFGLKFAEVRTLYSIASSLKVIELAGDPEPCSDGAPVAHPDAGFVECIKPHGHRSLVHRGADGSEWTEAQS